MASKKYVKHFLKVIYLHSVHLLSAGGLSLLPNFQERGPDRISFFFSRGREGSHFYIKNKLKSEILNKKIHLDNLSHFNQS